MPFANWPNVTWQLGLGLLFYILRVLAWFYSPVCFKFLLHVLEMSHCLWTHHRMMNALHLEVLPFHQQEPIEGGEMGGLNQKESRQESRRREWQEQRLHRAMRRPGNKAERGRRGGRHLVRDNGKSRVLRHVAITAAELNRSAWRVSIPLGHW